MSFSSVAVRAARSSTVAVQLKVLICGDMIGVQSSNFCSATWFTFSVILADQPIESTRLPETRTERVKRYGMWWFPLTGSARCRPS